MARCFWILRISLGEMYHRLRRASLRIRSCMTCFLKRLSKFSCDSPSLRVTVANTLTSFPRSNALYRAGRTQKDRPAHPHLDCSRPLYDYDGRTQPPCLISKPRPLVSLPSETGGGPQALLGLHDIHSPQRCLCFSLRWLRPPLIQAHVHQYYSRFPSRRQSQSWR